MARRVRSIGRRPVTVLATTLLVAIGGIVGSSSTVSAQAGGGSVELVAQSAWIDDGGVFDIQVRVAGASPDSMVTLRIHEPVGSRLELLAEAVPTTDPLLEIGPILLSDLQATSNEILALQVAIVGPRTAEPGSDLGNEDDPLPVLRTEGGSGIYPIDVTLATPEGETADRFLTHLLELPRGRQSPPLQVVFIAPVDLEPGLSPTGEPDRSPDTARLETLLDAMEIHAEVEVTLDMAPETLSSLVRSDSEVGREVLERLATLTSPDEILPSAHVRVDEQAWLDAELDEELAELYDSGDRATLVALGFTPDRSVALLDPTLSDSGLDWLADQGVQGVIVRSAGLSRAPAATLDQAMHRQFLLPTEGGRSVPALESDTLFDRYLTGPGSAVLRANRLLADLTLIALERPDLRRSVTLIAPDDWTPDAQFLNVVLAGVERIPVIDGASPKTALSSTDFAPAAGEGSIGPPMRRELTPVDAATLGPFRTEYNQAASAIDSWRTVLTADPESTDRLLELLRLSADQRLDPSTRSAYIDSVYRLIDEQKVSALVTPDAETITLTGRETTLPIIVENRLEDPVSVVLVLDCEKLDFPEGAEVAVTLAPGSNRIEVPIEVLASGDSPIRVQILSPDRAVLLDSSEVVVRSFSFPGAGIVIGIGSIVVLVLWWLRQSRHPRGTLEPSPTI